MSYHAQVFVGAGDLSSDPLAYIVLCLLNELKPHLKLQKYYYVYFKGENIGAQ